MKQLRWFTFLIALLTLALTFTAQAQPELAIAYGEMRSAFYTPNSEVQRWSFQGQAGDVIEITAIRIAGQMQPQLKLIDASGNELATSTDNNSYQSEVAFLSGLPEDGNYTVEVTNNVPASMSPENPDEYVLALTKIGRYRNDNDLPSLGTETLPLLETGEGETSRLGLRIYGDIEVLPPEPSQPNIYTVQSGSQRARLDNNFPIFAGIRSITVQPGGMGFVIENPNLAQDEAIFYTNQEVDIAYINATNTYRFTFPSGQTIITDFYRINAIEAIDGLVAARFYDTNEEGVTTRRRALFDNQTIDLRRPQQGPNEEPLNALLLDDDNYVYTDAQGWHTLAYLDGQLQVLYGGQSSYPHSDGRFISSDVHIDALLQEDDRALIRFAGTNAPINLTLDWHLMGDVRVEDNALHIDPLDERSLTYSLDEINSVLIEDQGIQTRFLDDRRETSLPDNILIQTPQLQVTDNSALPNESGYIPRGYNNLGSDFLPACPCAHDLLHNGPVNPANGNFHMAVTDFSLPSHTLPLAFSRYYNSQGQHIGPAYLADQSLAGTLGIGWRHSYQYELDITYVAQGQVTLVMPSGTQHIFTHASEGRYQSRTLPQWDIQQLGGPLSDWVGYSTDGQHYYFDRAGRLTSITDSNGHELYLVQAPVDYMGSDWLDGVFIVEPYGRRLELYTGDSGHIERVNDPLLRSTSYAYESNTLTQVTQAGYEATYSYDDLERLTNVSDPRSPIASNFTFNYDERGRITSTIQAPDEVAFTSNYSYDDTLLITRRIREIGDQTYNDTWRYSDDLTNGRLLVARTIGSDDYEYTFSYSGSLLVDIRLPNLTRFGFQYDARGNLTQLKDPFAIYEPYQISYETRGERSLLTSIAYPNGSEDRFVYNANGQRIAHQVLVDDEPEETAELARHEYDDWGRLSLTIYADNSATAYFYDDFGYVAEVWQGIIWEESDTLADLTPERALRVMRYQHDLLGQLRSVSDSDGTWLINWQQGNISEIILPDGGTLTYSYNAGGRLQAVNDRGGITEYAYDALGHLSRITDPLGNIERWQYDALGRLISVTNAADEQTRYAYDLRGNLIEEVSPSGFVTTYEIVEEAPPSSRTQRIMRGPTGRVTTWRYDANGRLIQVTVSDDNRQQNYTIDYNSVGLPLRIQKENGRTLTYTYDLRGNVVNTQVGDLETNYAYDLLGRITQVTEANDSVTRYGYDALGNIVTITQPDGIELQADYNADGRIVGYRDALNNLTTYSYDANGRLIEVMDDAGSRTSYGYDERGNLASVRDPLGNARNYAYDLANNLVTEIDGLGHEITYGYDALNRLIGIDYNAQGRDLSLSYNPEGQISSLSAYRDRVRELYSYDPLGRLTSLTNPLGYTTTFRYNGLGELSGVIDAIGNEQTFTWIGGNYILGRHTDAAGRVHSYENTDSMGRLMSLLDLSTPESQALNSRFAYNVMGDIIQMQTFNVNSTSDQVTTLRYEYDINGRPTAYTDPNGGRWQFTYDDAGQIVMVQQPDGIQNTYLYDTWGNVTRATYAVGTSVERTEQFIYDAAGNLQEYTDPTGIVTRYDYDSNDNLVRVIQAADTEDERTHQFAYNELGQVTTYTNPLGTITEYRYSRDNLVQVRQPLGESEIATFYEYDLANNLVNIRLPHIVGENPSAINLAYNALNQRVRFTDTASNVWAYNYNNAGNLAQISDPLGSITRYAYDPYDRLVQITLPTNATVNYSYDILGNLEEIDLPPNAEGESQSIEYDFDRRGNLLSVRPSNDLSTQYTYDAVGNLLSQSPADGNDRMFAYDALGQPLEITGDTSLQATYDDAGRIIRLTDGDQTVTYAYDNLGRVVHATQQPANSETPTLTVNYEYDAADHVLVRSTDNLGTTTYEYNDLGRLVTISYADYSVSLAYDARGNITELTRSNGVTTFYSYDSNGRVVLVQHFDAEGERLDRFDYRYDAVGNLTRVDRTSPSSSEGTTRNASVLYTYDIAHRLISERWLDATGTTTYSLEVRYDNVGNRIETVRNGQQTLYRYDDDNQLIQTISDAGEETHYTYDDAGRIAEIANAQTTITFNYDSRGRLESFTRQTEGELPTAVSMDYDFLNRLTNWQMKSLRYAGDTVLAQLPDRYLTLPNGELILTLENGDARWHLNDGLGSTRRLTDSEGNLLDEPQWTHDFGSFGEWLSAIPGNTELLFGANHELYEPTLGIYLIDETAYLPELATTLQPTLRGQDSILDASLAVGLTVPDPAQPLANLPVAVNPEHFLQAPTMPEIPLPPATRALQEAELFRPLVLLSQTTYGTNLNNNVLSTTLHTLDAFTWQSTPAYTARSSLNQLMSLYNSQNSWVPDLRPQPQLHDEPLAMLSESMLLTQQPLGISTTLCDLPDISQAIPASSTATTNIQQNNIEQMLPNTLTPIQPQFAFIPYELPDINPLAWLKSQGTSQPVLDVLPEVVTQLDYALHNLASVIP